MPRHIWIEGGDYDFAFFKDVYLRLYESTLAFHA